MMSSEAPIVKTIVHAGNKFVPISDGSKVHFHFKTWKLGKEKTLLDDSKIIGTKEPMVLVIGHKFKLEVWESIVKMMAIGEVASFRVKKELVFSYPFVSKTLRELDKKPGVIKHACSMTLQTEGIGYPDLDEMIRFPTDLEFQIELLKVESADEYEKDMWQLTEQEKLDLVPVLKEKGNKYYQDKQYDEAVKTYGKALGILDQLMLRERKDDQEWKKLNEIKLPILLNYAQCKLMQKEYYAVIGHCSTVLEYDKDNEKALYRRAKAHIEVWNPIDAEIDLKRLKEINPSLTATVDQELAKVKQLVREKVEKDIANFSRLFITKNGKNGKK